MNGSKKAKLIVFIIIATLSFTISTTFANLTIHEDATSYKLIPIENDSFEPAYINKVHTIIPKNTTNQTHNHTTNYTINKTIEKINTTSKEDVED